MTVRKHNLSFRYRNQIRAIGSTSESCLSVEEVNVTYVLLVVVLGFLTCWTPVLVIDLIDFINADWKLKREVYVTYICFAFASSSLNPIIYGIMNRSFRAEYFKILALIKARPSDLLSRSSRSVRGSKRNGNLDKHLDKNKVGDSFKKGVEKNAGNDASVRVKHSESSGKKN